ncbi:MAG: DUF3344 domain-containing protein [Halobacteriota archaeon]
MNTKKTIGLFTIALLGMIALTGGAAAATWTVHPTDPGADYTTITLAIDAGTTVDGDSIEVWNSTYNEYDIDVNKRLTIYSRDGVDVTIVDGTGSTDNVFKVTVNQVNITGLTVTGATSGDIGIKLHYVNGCNISYNNVSGNTWGIRLYYSSYDNIVEGNIASNSDFAGIHLQYSDENVVTGNTVTDNRYGIYLYQSDYNEVTNKSAGNTVMNNTQHGIYLYDADDNEITCNLVAYNAKGTTTPKGGIYLTNGATGNNISFNNIIENGDYNAGTGGWEWNFNNNQISDVVAEDNWWETTDSDEIAASINENSGTVDYIPFATEPVPCAPDIERPPITTLYFVPSHNVVEGYGNTVEVMVMVDAPEGINGAQFAINYSSACAKIVNVEYNPVWVLDEWNDTAQPYCWGPGHDWLKPGAFQDYFGAVWICNITIQSNSTTWCKTNLNFTCGLNCIGCQIVLGSTSGGLEFETVNGTFTNMVTAEKDSYIWQSAADQNFGDLEDLDVVSWKPGSSKYNKRTLAQFDISGLPSEGVSIDSATLHMYMYDAPPKDRNYSTHRLTNDWVEGTTTGPDPPADGVTWNNRTETEPWDTAGGDYAPRTSFTATGTTSGVWVDWDVTEDVRSFRGGVLNYGWVVKDMIEDEANMQKAQFRSSEYIEDVTRRPYLDVKWSEQELPDLSVVKVEVNPEIRELCNYMFAHQPNNFSATIRENNGFATGGFNVTFKLDDGSECNCSGSQGPMTASEERTIWCNCSWIPSDMLEHTINVTVDSDGDIGESNESNNVLNVPKTVRYHALKGDGFQDGRNITTLRVEQGNINMAWSTGNSTRKSGWSSIWYPRRVGFGLPIIPDDAGIEEARLYVYYSWDTRPALHKQYPGEVNYTNNVTHYFNLTFNGVEEIPKDAVYTDNKMSPIPDDCLMWYDEDLQGMCEYNYDYGMVAYNVTELFDPAAAENTAVLANTQPNDHPTPANMGAPREFKPRTAAFEGMVLMVVYSNDTEPERTIWLNEGFDRLFAGDEYAVSSEEATTYAPFSGVGSSVGEAMLITIVTNADNVKYPPADDINRLYFNGALLGSCPWELIYYGLLPTGIAYNETDVTGLITSGDNIAGLQSHINATGDADWMEPANAVLVVTAPTAETYTIDGYIFDSGGVPQLEPEVNITNLDNGKEWAALITDNFYTLTLNVGVDVNASETLLIVACKNVSTYEHNCNVTNISATIPGGDHNVNRTLNHYCLNWHPRYPYHTWNESNWSGPAVMEMCIDNYRDPPYVPNQTELNDTGLSNNYGCNSDLLYVDTQGMYKTLNHYLHAWQEQPYVANYGRRITDDRDYALHYICYYQRLGPGVAPAYGDYSNWMVVRGIHTNVSPPSYAGGGYDIYGFWINDPNPTGIGENTYKTVDQWNSEYYVNLSGVSEEDPCYNKYVAVCEPPEHDAEVRLVHSAARFDRVISAVQMKKLVELKGVEKVVLVDIVEDEDALEVVKAAIDGVTEELAPYDRDFAVAFARTVAGEPIFVNGGSSDYYLVPFDVAEGTQVVVLVDAEDGSFMEASWVKEPVKYLPVSRAEALELVADELGELPDGTAIELMHPAASPYYPVWKVTIDELGLVFFVSQDGTVSYEGTLPGEVLRETLENNAKVFYGIYKAFEIDAAGEVAKIAEYGLEKEIYNDPRGFVELIRKSSDAEYGVVEQLLKQGVISKKEAEGLFKQVKYLQELSAKILSQKKVTFADAVKVAHAQDDVAKVMQTFTSRPVAKPTPTPTSKPTSIPTRLPELSTPIPI